MTGPDRSQRLRLPSSERMRASWEFRQVRERGRTLAGRAVVMNYLLPGMDPEIRVEGRRFGVVVGRKLGKAFQRNRVKRLLRESYRLSRPLLVEHCRLVMVGRKAVLSMGREDVRQDFLRIAAGAGLLVRPESPHDPSHC